MSRRHHLAPVRASFHTVVRAAVPAARELDAAGWERLDAVVEGALDDRPPGVRHQLRLFLRLLSVLAFLRYGRGLGRLDTTKARALLQALERSRLLLLRRGVWGLRTLAFMGFYGREEGRRAVGYAARLRGWEARGGDAGPWPTRGGAGAPEAGIVVAGTDATGLGEASGGGTVARRLAPLARAGKRVLVLERGPRFHHSEFNGDELEMAPALYADSGGFLTADGTMTLAFGRAYGGSTVVYTGTSLPPPRRVVEAWGVPGLDHDDLVRRAARYAGENHVHLLPDEEINGNNRLFVEGCLAAGYEPHQFPVNVRGCKGSSLCNLGCPNGAKQGTHQVQLPAAEEAGVEVVTRARVTRLEERAVHVRVAPRPEGALGAPSEWEPGEYRVRADTVVLSGGTMGSVPLLLRSGFGAALPRLGEGFTCHPAFILVGEHDDEVQNDVGHPKSFYVDRGREEGWVLETCMYFPFVTAKNLTGFGPDHEALMRAFPRLQMILVLACDKAVPGNRVGVGSDGAPRVEYRFTPAVVESMVAATRAAARIFFGAGARRVHAPPADPPLLERGEADSLDQRIRAEHFLPGRLSVSAAHLMGGSGMGSGPADSVTDHRGRVHGHPWLRVADASLFPDSIEINPYLTIMALADGVAEGVLEDQA